jgi:hypothetical protein
MNPEAEKLYNLLPALYRMRDVEHGGALQALCEVIAEEIAVLRENLDQLYDDQFIETCAEWVAPYIGDLIGYRALHGVSARTRSARAEVANTIAYRRRKGTATVLEQLARDVTGWNARAVEFFQWLETSQYMNHIRPANGATPDLRNWEALERRDTAFNTMAHSVDMRRIETQKGRYNIPNVGLFLWRLDAFSLTKSPALRIDDERFLFSPLGNDTQLFTRPKSETDISHLAEPINVPEPISRRVLASALGRYYQSKNGLLVEESRKSIAVEADNVDTAIGDIQVCNLSDHGTSWAHLPVSKISIDPVLGRIAFPPVTAPVKAPKNVRVSFHYGFSMPMGGGEYERRSSFALGGAANVVVSQNSSLQSALSSVTAGGIVEIGDSGRYKETLAITVGATKKVELRAVSRAPEQYRPTIVLDGDLHIDLAAGAELTLNGLLITGGRLHVHSVGGSGPRILRLRHCTLVPGLALTQGGDPVPPIQPSSVIVDPANIIVEIDSCIIGGLRCAPGVAVEIANSIVDATAFNRVAFAYVDEKSAGGTLTIENSTVIGKVHTARLDLASNVLFMAHRDPDDERWSHPVISDQNQQGCVRFCFVPLDSIVPRRYRCQPDLAVTAALTAADVPKGSLSNVKRLAITTAVQERVRPAFTTLRYGQPGYCQLGSSCPVEIRTGAEDESEMGAFHDVFAPHRESNLKIRLHEYLRFGLEAGIFYAT